MGLTLADEIRLFKFEHSTFMRVLLISFLRQSRSPSLPKVTDFWVLEFTIEVESMGMEDVDSGKE